MAFSKTMALGFLAASQLLSLADAVSLSVSTSGGNASSPLLYGFMFEDINHSGDGGIHGQLLRNNGFQGDVQDLTAYAAVGDVELTVDSENPLSDAVPFSLKVTVPEGATGQVGFLNEGYWGIPVTQDTYENYFWVKGAYSGTVTLQLVGVTDGTIYATHDMAINGTADAWSSFTAVFDAEAAPDGNNVWQLLFDSSLVAGQDIFFDLVQLFPTTFNERYNGLRPEIANSLVDLQGSFLRFPGGNNLEGAGTVENRWTWYNTIGPVESRPGRQGVWGYPNSDALGLMEYLLWCEDMGLTIILDVWAGLLLNGDAIITGEELKPYIQEALDEIEYVMGSEDTPNGALRASHGHPEPFPLAHVEVGNEDDLSNGCESYASRFTDFYNAIRAAYPDLVIIASTTNDDCLPNPKLEGMWTDQHHYLNPDEFVGLFNEFDNKDRSFPVFVGEYAVTLDVSGGSLERPIMIGSVAEAVYMIGMERNSEVVMMAAYAPLLQHFADTQWTPDLVGWDSNPDSLVRSTSYFVQQMFSTNRGDTILPVESDSDFGPVYWVASISDTNHFVKLANYGAEVQTVDIAINGTTSGSLTVLSGAETDSNNPEELIVPVVSDVTAADGVFSIELPAWSVAVLAAV